MAAFLTDNAIDALLNYIKNNAEVLHICSAQPTAYGDIATYSLGSKSTPTIGSPANGDTSGRKITISAITDGTVSGTGTATHWALVDVTGTELLFSQALSSSQGVTSGNTFTLPAIDIENPDPTA